MTVTAYLNHMTTIEPNSTLWLSERKKSWKEVICAYRSIGKAPQMRGANSGGRLGDICFRQVINIVQHRIPKDTKLANCNKQEGIYQTISQIWNTDLFLELDLLTQLYRFAHAQRLVKSRLEEIHSVLFCTSDTSHILCIKMENHVAYIESPK